MADNLQTMLLVLSMTRCIVQIQGQATSQFGLSTNSQIGAVLERMGLNSGAIRNIMMHRDIVPRAFTCDYALVADLLPVVGDSFRNLESLRNPERQASLFTHSSFIGPIIGLGSKVASLPYQSCKWKLLKKILYDLPLYRLHNTPNVTCHSSDNGSLECGISCHHLTHNAWREIKTSWTRTLKTLQLVLQSLIIVHGYAGYVPSLGQGACIATRRGAELCVWWGRSSHATTWTQPLCIKRASAARWRPSQALKDVIYSEWLTGPSFTTQPPKPQSNWIQVAAKPQFVNLWIPLVKYTYSSLTLSAVM